MKIKTFYRLIVAVVFSMMFALAAAAQQPVAQQIGAANAALQNGESVVSTVSRAKSLGRSIAKLGGKKNKVAKNDRTRTDDGNQSADNQSKDNRIKPVSPVPTADQSDAAIRRDARRRRVNTGFNTSDPDDDDDVNSTGDDDQNEIRELNRQTRPRYAKIE